MGNSVPAEAREGSGDVCPVDMRDTAGVRLEVILGSHGSHSLRTRSFLFTNSRYRLQKAVALKGEVKRKTRRESNLASDFRLARQLHLDFLPIDRVHFHCDRLRCVIVDAATEPAICQHSKHEKWLADDEVRRCCNSEQ